MEVDSFIFLYTTLDSKLTLSDIIKKFGGATEFRIDVIFQDPPYLSNLKDLNKCVT